MGTATGLGGASGRYPAIVIVAQPWKEEEGMAWMIRTTIVFILDGGGHQQHRWSFPADAVVVLVIVGRVSRSASRPDAGGRERQRCNHKFYAIDKLNQLP